MKNWYSVSKSRNENRTATYHCNSPAANDCSEDIDGNANLALLEDSPIERQYGELDATDNGSVTEFRNEKTLRPDDSSIRWAYPDVFTKAVLSHWDERRQTYSTKLRWNLLYVIDTRHMTAAKVFYPSQHLFIGKWIYLAYYCR